jgi:hypothetical protein
MRAGSIVASAKRMILAHMLERGALRPASVGYHPFVALTVR